MAPSTRSAGYRCSLPGLAGFTGVPSPGTAPYLSQNGPEIQRSRTVGRGKNAGMAADKEKIIEVGQKAPAFTLPDQDDKTVKLSDFKGQLAGPLLLSRTTTRPAAPPRPATSRTASRTSRSWTPTVVGCSPNTTESHRKFIAKYKLKVRLLSDPEHKAMDRLRRLGREGPLRQEDHRRHPLDGDHRPRRQDRPPLGPREVRRPRRSGPRKAQGAPRRLSTSIALSALAGGARRAIAASAVAAGPERGRRRRRGFAAGGR